MFSLTLSTELGIIPNVLFSPSLLVVDVAIVLHLSPPF